MSLAILLRTELEEDVAAGFDTYGISAPGPWVEAIQRLGVTHVPVHFTRSWDLGQDVRAARQLRKALQALDLHILHTHTPKAGVVGRILGRRSRIPVVVNTCHGLWASPEDRVWKRSIVYAVEAAAAQCSDAELYQNDADRHTLRRAVPARRAMTVGNGVDLTRFQRDEEARARYRAELGVANDVVLIGGVGRLVPEKGLAEFELAARALARRRDAAFVWAGPAEPSSPWPSGGEASSVRYLGMVENTVPLYSALDVFVLPSYREGFSRSSMEAAACGCALVLTDIRGCREVGIHEKHLLLVPPGDGHQLTAAIERLLDQPKLRTTLASAAIERARRCFDQRDIAARSFESYRRAAEHKRLPWAANVPRQGSGGIR